VIENNAPDVNVNWFLKVLDWVVTIGVPVILVLVTIRLLLNPWFLDFEYRTPGFPEDRYGFTQAERLYWSKITLEYLVNDAGIDYLADLRFTDGQQVPEPSCSYMNDCTLLYNDRELSHMVDVKNAVVIANRVMWIAIGIVALIGIFAWRGKWLKNYRLAVARGGWLALLLTVSIILFVLMAFSVIFVWFHEIFFEPGTWTFFYSDTLIRLFPERLWRDTFLIVAGLPALLGAAMGYFLGKRTVKIRR
jgi:integral membrane protein (TIGR01906 family)